MLQAIIKHSVALKGWSVPVRTSLLALTAGLVTASVAMAQSYSGASNGQWKGALFFGYDANLAGDFHGSASGDFAGLPASINKGSYSDVYDAPIRYGAEVTYGTSNFSEFFARLSYARASGKTTNIGTAASAFAITAQFDDYKEYEASAGYRQYFRMNNTALTPYVAGSLGLKRVDEIRGTLSVPDANITLSNAQFYDASWVPTAGVDAGLLYPVTANFAVSFEAGLHYQFGLSGNDETLGNPLVGSGLDSLNEEGSKLTFPMAVKGMVKF
jgi:hypothetical protein